MATTVALVLGSGGARGYAHIGVIEELLARGYDITAVAGSSMGALVGGGCLLPGSCTVTAPGLSSSITWMLSGCWISLFVPPG